MAAAQWRAHWRTDNRVLEDAKPGGQSVWAVWGPPTRQARASPTPVQASVCAKIGDRHPAPFCAIHRIQASEGTLVGFGQKSTDACFTMHDHPSRHHTPTSAIVPPGRANIHPGRREASLAGLGTCYVPIDTRYAIGFPKGSLESSEMGRRWGSRTWRWAGLCSRYSHHLALYSAHTAG